MKIIKSKKGILIGAGAVVLAAAVVLCIVLGPASSGTAYYDYGKIAAVRSYEYVDTGWKPEEKEPNHILSAMEVGSWSTDYATDIIGSYDLSNGTKWNPLANIGFVGDPGGLYLLDGVYSVKSVSILFSKRGQFFDLYSSMDGKNYKKEASVTADNYKKYYAINGDIYKCNLTGLDIAKTAFLKVVFTGSTEKTSRYVNMHEISFEGTRVGDGPSEIPESNKWVGLGETLIDRCKVIGSWKRDRLDSASLGPKLTFDGNVLTWWNPEANAGYTGDPGIIFTLKAPTDIAQIDLYFHDSITYFDLYVSRDDKSYENVAMIRNTNADKGYSDIEYGNKVCKLGPLNKKGIKYVKIIFKGRTGGNTFVNFCEIDIKKTSNLNKDVSWLKDVGGSNEVYAVSHTVLGEWKNDRKTQNSLGPALSYDFDPTSKWNPQAFAGYTGKPGIVYTLNKSANLQKISVDFSSAYHYFDVYVSSDNKNYSLVASVCGDNVRQAYKNGYTATLDGLNLTGIKYVKLIFTGREDGNTYVNLVQIWFSERGNSKADTSWFIPAIKDNSIHSIVSYTISGDWQNDRTNGDSYHPVLSYDRDKSSKWNPQAKAGFTGEPAITYKLQSLSVVNKIEITFGGNRHYFDLYVSKDGTTFDKAASISHKNADAAYGNTTVCLLDGLNLKDVLYIKFVFKGRETSDLYLNICEVLAYSEGQTGIDTSWMLPDEDNPEAPKIISHSVIGNWVRSREGEGSYYPALAYDDNPATKWNPQADTAYAGEPGIVFTLDKVITLRKIEITFSSGRHYFDVFVSKDGAEYTKIAKINASNADKAYNDYVATLDGFDLTGIKFVKLIFTGRDTVNTYVNLNEISVSENGTQGADISWMLPKESLAVKSHTVTGEFIDAKKDSQSAGPQNSYDDNESTKWNPQAKTGYAGAPGIVYNLKQFSSLSEIDVTVTGRQYYFDIFTSENGTDYTSLMSVNSTNASVYYGQTLTAKITDIAVPKAGYIKLVFTGCAENNTYINLNEVVFYGEASEEPTGGDAAVIVSHTLTGSFVNNRASDSTYGPNKVYDGNTGTKWNPQVNTSYAGEPGIILNLENPCTLSKLTLTFASRKYYFNVLASADGESYTSVAELTSANSGDYYSGFICTLDELNFENCKYVKIVFTGAEAGSTWVNFQEAVIN